MKKCGILYSGNIFWYHTTTAISHASTCCQYSKLSLPYNPTLDLHVTCYLFILSLSLTPLMSFDDVSSYIPLLTCNAILCCILYNKNLSSHESNIIFNRHNENTTTFNVKKSIKEGERKKNISLEKSCL